MGLETVSTGSGAARLHQLDHTNPESGDAVNRGDDHIRNVKKAIKDQFSGISGDTNSVSVTANATELNKLDGCTATTTELNKLAGCTANTTELNKLDGLTASTSDLNILDGVTANTSELNKLDGLTATTAELNTLASSNMTSAKMANLAALSTTEVDILDGCTATTAELNYLDGLSSNAQTQLNSKQATLTAGNNININGATISSSNAPDVVSGHLSTATTYTNVNTDWVYIPMNEILVDVNGIASENNTYVQLPAGSYYFEAGIRLRNSNTGSATGSVYAELVDSNNNTKGYADITYMGESDSSILMPKGTFTLGGNTELRLRVKASENNKIKYNDTNGLSNQRIASTVKFWKTS